MSREVVNTEYMSATQKNSLQVSTHGSGDYLQTMSDNKPNNNSLGSPSLPPEKLQQLRNLKEKKLKQAE